MSRILIADDQPDVLEALRILLKGEGHQTDAVTSLGAVMNALDKRTYALLMMDLNYTRDTTSGQEGLEVIPRIQTIDETLPIVVMTAWATVDLAVEAMKLGARRVHGDADQVPCFLDLADDHGMNIAGERETAAGSLDDLSHFGGVAHVRLAAADIVGPAVVVHGALAELE
jgi:CheY-like chemotaxis protein